MFLEERARARAPAGGASRPRKARTARFRASRSSRRAFRKIRVVAKFRSAPFRKTRILLNAGKFERERQKAKTRFIAEFFRD